MTCWSRNDPIHAWLIQFVAFKRTRLIVVKILEQTPLDACIFLAILSVQLCEHTTGQVALTPE